MHDDTNLVGVNVVTIKKNTQSLIYACKDVVLEVNTEKTKLCYCLVTKKQGKIMT